MKSFALTSLLFLSSTSLIACVEGEDTSNDFSTLSSELRRGQNAANGADNANNPEKFDVCKLDDDGEFKLIKVGSEAALNAHLANGSGEPFGEVPDMPGYVFGPDCTPELQGNARVTISVGNGNGTFYPCAVSLNSHLACKPGYPQQIFELERGEAGLLLHSTSEKDLEAIDPDSERYNNQVSPRSGPARGDKTCVLTSGRGAITCFSDAQIEAGLYGARTTEYEITETSMTAILGTNSGEATACWSTLGYTYCSANVNPPYGEYRIHFLD